MAVDQALLASSRNLHPSYFMPEPLVTAEFTPACIDIEEPLSIRPGESKVVSFRYQSGDPPATAYSITWHASEAEADALVNQLQDEPLPSFEINPPYPRHDLSPTAWQIGTVRLVAPSNMRATMLWGAMTIYQE